MCMGHPGEKRVVAGAKRCLARVSHSFWALVALLWASLMEPISEEKELPSLLAQWTTP